MSVPGTDWSHWNINPDPHSYDFIIHKATQGTTNVDSEYHKRAQWIRDLGKIWGAYLFPVTNKPAAKQVDHFILTADIRPGEIVALDFEDDGTWKQYTPRQLAELGNDCMSALVVAYPNNRVVLYCNRWTWNNVVKPFGVHLGDGLWIASPGLEPTMDWVIWQYGNGSVDYDRANFTTLNDFTHWVKKTPKEEDDMTPEQADQLTEIQGRLRQLTLNGAQPLPENQPVNDWRAGGDLTQLWASLDQVLIAPLRAQLEDLTAKVDQLAGGTQRLTGTGSITFTPADTEPPL